MMDDYKAINDSQWREKLSDLEYKVLREGATEAPNVGEYVDHKPVGGYYSCRGCGNPLFSATAKFDSGCGWPSFDKCYFSDALNGCHVEFRLDTSLETRHRIEILCRKCDGHLGHIFLNEETRDLHDGDSERFCVNSVSIKYNKQEPNVEGLCSLSSKPTLKQRNLLKDKPSDDFLESKGTLEEVQDLVK